jgi:hypothetical protein
MVSVPTGSTTVPELPDPFVRGTGLRSPRFAGLAQPAVDFRIGDVLTGLPAADQKPLDNASRSVPQTPKQGG